MVRLQESCVCERAARLSMGEGQGGRVGYIVECGGGRVVGWSNGEYQACGRNGDSLARPRTGGGARGVGLHHPVAGEASCLIALAGWRRFER